jgi:hypothetical protein
VHGQIEGSKNRLHIYSNIDDMISDTLAADEDIKVENSKEEEQSVGSDIKKIFIKESLEGGEAPKKVETKNITLTSFF